MDLSFFCAWAPQLYSSIITLYNYVERYRSLKTLNNIDCNSSNDWLQLIQIFHPTTQQFEVSNFSSFIAFRTLLIFQFDAQLSYDGNEQGRCQRSHGLRFDPKTAANRTLFKAQGHIDWKILWTRISQRVFVVWTQLGSRLFRVSKRNPCEHSQGPSSLVS